MEKNKIISENELIPYGTSALPEGPYLVFAPHPDDETLGMGGTIALAVKKKIRVYVVFVTSGDAGGDPAVRVEETRRASSVLGVEKCFYLEMPDRGVGETPLPEAELERILSLAGPATVFLPSFQEIHPDHRYTTLKILPFFKKINKSFCIWFYEINRQGEVNALIDITSMMHVKERAIESYGSQQEQLDYKAQCLNLDSARSFTAGDGIDYCEGFWVHNPADDPVDEYLSRLMSYFPGKNEVHEDFNGCRCNSRILKETIKHQEMMLARYEILTGSLAAAVNDRKKMHWDRSEECARLRARVDELESFAQGVKLARSHRLASGYIDISRRLRSFLSRLKALVSGREGSAHRASSGSDDGAENTVSYSPLPEDLFIEGGLSPVVVLSSEEGKVCNIVHERKAAGVTSVIPVHTGSPVAFRIDAGLDNLSCIKIFMATYERINPGILKLELYAGKRDSVPLRRAEISSPSIMDNAFSEFRFEPVADSLNRSFYVVLSLENGEAGMPAGLWARPDHQNDEGSSYDHWIENNESLAGPENEAGDCKISVIMPVNGAASGKLSARAMGSLASQSCRLWELILLDLTGGGQGNILNPGMDDERITVLSCDSEADIGIHLNRAVEISTSDYFLCLNPEDTLALSAVKESGNAAYLHPDAEAFYSDEDKLSGEGRRHSPFFKPDWSRELALSLPSYPGSLLMFRKDRVKELGGFAEGFGEAASYELMLRISEATDKIVHIPKVLYHRGDISINDLFPYRRALESAVAGSVRGGTVHQGLVENSFRVSSSPEARPGVSIIIPFRDYPDLLETAVESVLSKTTYTNYEIICVNNRSSDPRTLALMGRLNTLQRVRVMDDDRPFNYSSINNTAVSHARGEMILFLNSDTEVISENWLEYMLEYACRKEIGAVGAKLYFADDTIQHAGIVLGIVGLAGHAFKHVERDDSSFYHGLPSVVRNVSGVTGACMMIRREVFEAVGGFDEENFPISYNDLDLCLKLRQEGYRIIFTPFAELYHYESYSRGYAYDDDASMKIREKWGKTILTDPFYNINLTAAREDWSL